MFKIEYVLKRNEIIPIDNLEILKNQWVKFYEDKKVFAFANKKEYNDYIYWVFLQDQEKFKITLEYQSNEYAPHIRIFLVRFLEALKTLSNYLKRIKTKEMFLDFKVDLSKYYVNHIYDKEMQKIIPIKEILFKKNIRWEKNNEAEIISCLFNELFIITPKNEKLFNSYFLDLDIKNTKKIRETC